MMPARWGRPNAIGHVRIYFKTRNCQNPLWRRINRSMCRYWIRKARHEAKEAAYIARAEQIRARAAELGLVSPSWGVEAWDA